MVSCLQNATVTYCQGGGALPGVFLYPTGLNVADGQQMKLQIITNSYACDDTGYIATEYCIDWGDGTHTSGTFSGAYAVPGNVELQHVYYFPAGYDYYSMSYEPSVTISNACGGIRTVNTDDAGRACRVYVWRPGTNPIPVPNMSNGYKLYSTFNEASCAGIFPDCTTGETDSACVDGFTRKCIDGFWARDLNSPCTGGSSGVGYVPPSGGNDGGYIPPSDSGSAGYGYVPTPTNGGTAGGTDIFGDIMNFYENNKMISIAGIALIGGFVLFGGD